MLKSINTFVNKNKTPIIWGCMVADTLAKAPFVEGFREVITEHLFGRHPIGWILFLRHGRQESAFSQQSQRRHT